MVESKSKKHLRVLETHIVHHISIMNDAYLRDAVGADYEIRPGPSARLDVVLP